MTVKCLLTETIKRIVDDERAARLVRVALFLSSALYSLNHDHAAITDVEALAGAVYALALEVVINFFKLRIEN